MDAIQPLRMVNESLGWRVFGNVSGASDNVFYRLALKKAQMKSGVTADPLFGDECFVSLGNIEEEIREFQEYFSEAIEDPSRSVEKRYDGEVASRMVNPDTVEETPPLEAVLTDSVREGIRNYYGSGFDVMWWRGYRNYHHPSSWALEDGKYVSIKRWHLDPFPLTTVRMFVLLDDVGSEDGPTTFIPVQDMEKINPEFVKGASIPPEDLEHNNIETFTGEAGDAALFNPQMAVHRAGDPEEGRRRDMLSLKLVPHRSEPALGWAERDFNSYNKKGIHRSGFKQLLHA